MTLGQAYKECLPYLDQMKAAGVPFHERIKGLDAVIRQFWPHREEPWHFHCTNCEDRGLEMPMRECNGNGCGLAKGKPHLPHEYSVPCWCEQGRRFRPKQRTEDTAIEAAARIKKPTRFGR